MCYWFMLAGRRQENSFSFSESYKVSEPAQLSVSSSDGNIEVLPSAQSGIELRYIVKRNNKLLQISRAELEKEVTLEITTTANSLKINVKYPNNSGFFDSNNRITVSFKILVPKQTASELRTSDGNISISGLTSDQQLYTSDGNIHVSAIKGTIKGRTSDGNVMVKDVGG